MDLWTDRQAAEHWGVTASRARTILASRGIRRVAGYPSSEIRAVRRRQGARTDLIDTGVDSALTLSATAEAIRAAADDDTALRHFFEFMRGAESAGPAALRLIEDEPMVIGRPRFDALLGAAAEHVAARLGEPGPLWSVAVERFLIGLCWVSDLPSGRALAVVGAPAAFRRRGIYLDRNDLRTDESLPLQTTFGKPEILPAFRLLADKLVGKNVVGTVHVVGGAAMLLSYRSRVITRDIDALFAPDAPMRRAIRDVAAELGWPSTWLNNQASSYVARKPGHGARVFDHPNLHVMATPPEHLLAMKVLASRSVRDRGDIELLLGVLNITSAQRVWSIVDLYFPDVPIPDRARLLIGDLLPQKMA